MCDVCGMCDMCGVCDMPDNKKLNIREYFIRWDDNDYNLSRLPMMHGPFFLPKLIKLIYFHLEYIFLLFIIEQNLERALFIQVITKILLLLFIYFF